jgi:hypothetical protein
VAVHGVVKLACRWVTVLPEGVAERTLPIVEASELELGSVFIFSDEPEPSRVLFVNHDVVMYDAWWSHRSDWGMADISKVRRGAWSYYITERSIVLERAAYVRTEPLSAKEAAIHRPDLPFAIGQGFAASWSSVRTEAEDAFADNVVAVARVYLTPYGPKGGDKRSVLVEADNGSSFTIAELMRKAFAAQAPYVGDEMPTAGVGVYRLGLRRGVPSYYLWGAESRLHQH